MRVQVTTRPTIGDGRAHAVARRLTTVGFRVEAAHVADVYLLSRVPGLTADLARELFCDSVAQEVSIDGDRPPAPPAEWTFLVEVGYKPAVADPVASSIRDALGSELGALPPDAIVQTAHQFFLQADGGLPALARELYNPLIQHATIITRAEWETGTRPPALYPTVGTAPVPPVERINVATMTDAELEALSRDRLLALTLPEMQAIRAYYAAPPVRPATDVELEMIAQTWSEHCKHKIFAARVEYREGDGEPEIIDSLYKTYIQATTKRVADPDFVKSVFHDNAGVVKFDDETLVCFKAETHNSPSALDPYGGAITGIVGVNRDILGTGKGARPIFNTDILCFGYPDTPAESLPEGLLHPRVVMDGVHRGIVDGGNQSGIPVAAGAFLFDESYTGKPLVFCGTGGILPARINGEDAWVKHVEPGDLAVMVGGLVGKDGIHGATFSSLALDETSPTSAVQIGEPITQKKMSDFLLEARDLGLYKGITDNGAGGLSSSLGEMARDSGGVRIDLDACPLKYQGLAAWEILVSESQERMSLAVDPEQADEFFALAERRGVVATAVGEFTETGLVEATHRGELVVSLTLDFLHDGLPQMVIPARWPADPPAATGATPASPADPIEPSAPTRSPAPTRSSAPTRSPAPGTAAAGPSPALHDRLLALLRDPNIGSKEHLVRQYDHEVQGGSVVKPHVGLHADAPSDGAVIRPRLDSARGITVTHGICPRRSDADTYDMAVAAVDEAVRAHVALGGDPEQMAALDNFCWPDPVLSDTTPDGPYKMAQLVRACRGLADACHAYRLPLISGKDSMKNDARMGGRKVSIRPTLLVSLTGIVPDTERALTPHFKHVGDRVLLVGEIAAPSAAAVPGPAAGAAAPTAPDPRPVALVTPEDAPDRLSRAFELYKRLHLAAQRGLLASVHDVSDGGAAVALAEAAIGGRLGARIALDAVGAADGSSGGRPAAEYPPGASGLDSPLFAEPIASFVVTCRPERLHELSEILGDSAWRDVGSVIAEPELVVESGGVVAEWSMDELVNAWKSFAATQGASTEPRTVAAGGAARAVGTEPAVAGGGTRRPEALVLTGYGINADHELVRAFEVAGARVTRVHVNDLLGDAGVLERARIVGVPGGFSYGDHVGSGMMLAHRLRGLRAELDRFRDSGGLVIGICNGFQVLVKMGILPDLAGEWRQEVSLVHNDSGAFEDSWVTIEADRRCASPWLEGISRLDVPIRHGEGRFVVDDRSTLDRLERSGLVALRYAGRNPNGSQAGVAGIVDRTGNVLGMMPHPEAFLAPQNHPNWPDRSVDPNGGLAFFRNAVRHAS